LLHLSKKKELVLFINYPLLKAKRANSLAVRWLIQSARKRYEKGIAQKLIKEIQLVYEGRSTVYRKKKELNDIVLANRAFIRYLRKR